MLITYGLMIVPTVFFINNIGIHWGPAVVFVAVLLLVVTLR